MLTAAGGVPFKDETRKQLAATIDEAEATGILLGEYHILTKDNYVPHALETYTAALAKGSGKHSD